MGAFHMREVAVQAANDTNKDQDRANLQAEINALMAEIDRISSKTTWAGKTLMAADGGTDFSFQVGGNPRTVRETLVGEQFTDKAFENDQNMSADPKYIELQKKMKNVFKEGTIQDEMRVVFND